MIDALISALGASAAPSQTSTAAAGEEFDGLFAAALAGSAAASLLEGGATGATPCPVEGEVASTTEPCAEAQSAGVVAAQIAALLARPGADTGPVRATPATAATPAVAVDAADGAVRRAVPATPAVPAHAAPADVHVAAVSDEQSATVEASVPSTDPSGRAPAVPAANAAAGHTQVADRLGRVAVTGEGEAGVVRPTRQPHDLAAAPDVRSDVAPPAALGAVREPAATDAASGPQPAATPSVAPATHSSAASVNSAAADDTVNASAALSPPDAAGASAAAEQTSAAPGAGRPQAAQQSRRGARTGDDSAFVTSVDDQRGIDVLQRAAEGLDAAVEQPALGAGIARRVAAVADALRNAPPPRRVTLELEELGGLRLAVSLRGDTVHVDVLGGPPATQTPVEWTRDLESALSERGYTLDSGSRSGAEQGHGGHDSTAHARDDDARPAPAARPRIRAAQRAGVDL